MIFRLIIYFLDGIRTESFINRDLGKILNIKPIDLVIVKKYLIL